MQQRFQLVRGHARAVAFGLSLNDTARYIVGIGNESSITVASPKKMRPCRFTDSHCVIHRRMADGKGEPREPKSKKDEQPGIRPEGRRFHSPGSRSAPRVAFFNSAAHFNRAAPPDMAETVSR
ncbi:MAG: hypothetical protein RIC55_29775 [Pirellulaceae bacterium]